MKLYELSPAAGSTTRSKRKGRGIGSGKGKTGGRGHKGQNARSGGGVRPGFEGGQMPLIRQLPKRGFKNYFSVNYTGINVSLLERFDSGSVVDVQALKDAGIIKKTANGGVKILGNGDLSRKLTVRANAFSESAKQKIEAAGGTVEEV
ncbi:MAG: 50S ribosomal protein L15 [Clostridiales bacterium]|nr:50S ribosomal protein L15 [Clostridiales bacterium]